VGGFAMVASGSIGLAGAARAVSGNLPVFLFLFALFVFAAGLDQAGALEHLARWIVSRTRRVRDLPLVLFASFGAISAFLVNDALVVVGVPLLLALAARLRLRPEALLLTLAYAVTVGSVLTPFGNPQNLLVSLGSGMRTPVTTFLEYLLLPTVANLALGGLYVRWLFGAAWARDAAAEVRSAAPPVPLLPRTRRLSLLARFPSVVLFPATVAVMIGTDLYASVAGGTAVPLYAIALGGAMIALLATPGRAEILRRIDWSILLLFAGLFVFLAGAVQGGVLAALQSVLPIPGPGRPAALPSILLASLGGAQLFSNVPWVGLQISVMHGLGYGAGTPRAWIALAAGSTLSGNVTLLGAASNLIVVSEAERAGVRISLGRFVRFGLPLTAMTVLVLYVCLSFSV